MFMRKKTMFVIIIRKGEIKTKPRCWELLPMEPCLKLHLASNDSKKVWDYLDRVLISLHNLPLFSHEGWATI